MCQFKSRRDAVWPIPSVIPVYIPNTFGCGIEYKVEMVNEHRRFRELAFVIMLGVFKHTVIWMFKRGFGYDDNLQWGSREGVNSPIVTGVFIIQKLLVS